MSGTDTLATWLGSDPNRHTHAAHAEGWVRVTFPNLTPGSDLFYDAVLERARERYRAAHRTDDPNLG
jgi:hypothetical protein